MKYKQFVIFAVLICMILLSACNGKHSSGMANVEKKEMLSIETEYGTLQYPAEYEDKLQTDIDLRKDSITVHFESKVKSKQYELFTVTIAPDEGDSVGTIKGEDGKVRNVFVEVFELKTDSLSDKDQDILYSMQEGVNDLIDALS